MLYKIEQLSEEKDLTNIELTVDELNALNAFEKSEIILEDDGKKALGFFTNDFLYFISDIFKRYDIRYTIKEIKNPNFINNVVSEYQTRKDQIVGFINKNITINDVLDKINNSGINSLNQLDYQILNGNK